MIALFCFAGIDEISVDEYKGVGHSDSEESDKSDSSESESASDEEPKNKGGQDTAPTKEPQKELTKTNTKDQPSTSQAEEEKADFPEPKDSALEVFSATLPDGQARENSSTDLEKDNPDMTKAALGSPAAREKSQTKEETRQTVEVEDSDSERELVIDLGEEQGAKERKRSRKDSIISDDATAGKSEGKSFTVPQ